MAQTTTLQRSAPSSLTLLPLCGSLLLDYELFSYFVMGRWEGGVEISSPGWLSRSYPLKELDLVKLHLPFKVGSEFFTGGMVKEIRIKENSHERIYRLQFSQEPFLPHEYYVCLDGDAVPVFASDTDFIDLFAENIKDCIHLKKGVLVYTKHLSAYFSRIIGFDNLNYPRFNNFFFDDIFKKLSEKIKILTEFYEKIMLNKKSKNFVIPDNFQIIHELIESEVNIDLINLAFKGGEHLPYILSIKQLEAKMFYSYNLLLLIYESFIRGNRGAVQEKLEKMIQRSADIS